MPQELPIMTKTTVELATTQLLQLDELVARESRRLGYLVPRSVVIRRAIDNLLSSEGL